MTPETWDPTPETPADVCAACTNGASINQANEACGLVGTPGTQSYNSCLLDFCYLCGSQSVLTAFAEVKFQEAGIPYTIDADGITSENGTTFNKEFFGDALPPEPTQGPTFVPSGIVFYASMQSLTCDNKLMDLSGNNYHGTIVMKNSSAPSAALLEDGSAGRGKYINFGNVIKLIQLPSVDDLIRPGSSSRSICYWEKDGGIKENPSTYRFSFGKHCPPAGSTFAARDGLGFMGCALDWDVTPLGESSEVGDGGWHHVCYTYNGAQVSVFVDTVSAWSVDMSLATTAAADG
jgi:hypothetical protein